MCIRDRYFTGHCRAKSEKTGTFPITVPDLFRLCGSRYRYVVNKAYNLSKNHRKRENASIDFFIVLNRLFQVKVTFHCHVTFTRSISIDIIC